MNKSFFSAFIVGVLFGALVSSTVFAVKNSNQDSLSRQTIKLKLGHSLDPSHPVHKGMLFLKKRLGELSGGRVELEIYPGSQLGSETQMLEMLQNGELEMAKSSAAALEAFIPEFSIFSVPYLFRDSGHQWKVLDGEVGGEMLNLGVSKGLQGLCYYDAGSRNFYTLDRPIRTPADLQGLKIRVMNSQSAIEMVKVLGGSPTPIAWGELYSSLQQGVVDGAENNPPSFYTNRHFEVCRHFTLDGHSRVPDLLLASHHVFSALPEQVKDWIRQAARESSDYQRKLWHEKTNEALEKCREEGVTIYEVDVSLFEAKVQPIFERIQGTHLGPWFRRIKAVK